LPRSVNLLARQTLITAAEGEVRDLFVSHCADSHLYLLEPYRFASVLGCSDCTIVVGAVQGASRRFFSFSLIFVFLDILFLCTDLCLYADHFLLLKLQSCSLLLFFFFSFF